jgi:hypothetical protein
VLCIAYSEPKHDIGRGIGCDGTHSASNLILCVDRQHCVFLNEAFKIYSITIEADLNEGKLWESWALLVLSKSGVNPECDLSIRVHHRWIDIIQLRSESSAVSKVAVLWKVLILAFQGLKLLCHCVIVEQAQFICDILEIIESFLRPVMNIHDGWCRILELATIGM